MLMRFTTRVLVASLACGLGACCGFRIGYRSVEHSATSSTPDHWQCPAGYLRIYFSSPDNLARISAKSGLMCVLEIRGQEPVRMSGYVYRDLRSPVWREMLAYQRWDEPEDYAFYGEVAIDDGALERLVDYGEFVVHSPGMFIRCPISNALVVPQADLVGSLPN